MKKLVLTVIVILSAMVVSNAQSGKEGPLRWNLDDNGKLTLTTTGVMSEYYVVLDVPWKAYKESIYQVVIGNGVTAIWDNAFSGCENLTSVTIGSSVKQIGLWAFAGCDKLSSITIPNSVREIKYMAFANCTGLTALTIPNSVKIIRESAFYGCIGLTSVKLSNMLTDIPTSAFTNCTSLTSIVIPNSVNTISSWVFNGCTELESVTTGNSVRKIDGYIFADCPNLTTLVIPSSVTVLQSNALVNHKEWSTVEVQWLKPVILSDKIFSNREDIALIVPAGTKAAYQSANGWKDFGTIVEKGESVNSVRKWENISWTVVDSTLTIMGVGIMPSAGYTNVDNFPWFTKSKGIKKAVIKDGITHIGRQCFYGYENLMTVVIPGSVAHIGDKSFSDCIQLKEVEVQRRIPIESYNVFHAFDGLDLKRRTLIVPVGTKATYQKAYLWKEFIIIEKEITSGNEVSYSSDELKELIRIPMKGQSKAD